MALDAKKLEDLSEADLASLISNSVAESRLIEYKQELRNSSDAERKEFFADVSSFANASGGHLIYGLQENAGTPTGIAPLAVADVNAETLRLESMIRDSIEPRMLV